MTGPTDDDLLRLKASLQAATPAPDPARRAASLAQAVANFDSRQAAGQEILRATRPNPDRPSQAGFLEGLRKMFDTLTSRPALTATTSIAALALGLAVTLPLTRAPLDTSAPVAEERARAESRDEGPGAPIILAEPAPQADAPAAPPQTTTAAPKAVVENEALDLDGSFAAEADGRAMALSDDALVRQQQPNTEAFSTATPNPVKITAEEPVSTFSIDVDTASYAVVRSSLMAGALPDPAAVRVEEMINYFPYDYPAPQAVAAPFQPFVQVMPTPWNPGTRLVQIALQGRMPAVESRPPLNLVFLIDTSGSMQDANKLPLLKQSLRLMLGALRDGDQVAIVAYAGSAGTVLPPTAARDSATILAALDRLEAGGSTAGAEGLALAYQVAQGMTADGEISRVLLATDGDFNVGVSDPDGLEAFVARQREQGTYLSVLGFGRGNLDDAVMQALAQNGNGTASYIDTLSEARKVLVDQVTGALFPIADDVKVQVEWNPAQVAEYRLIGYETRALAREDFSNDQVDAGEIGAGLQVTALYEITAPGSTALLNDPLRYQTEGTPSFSPELGFLRLRYKDPGASESQLIETPIEESKSQSPDSRFAAAIAGFGLLLQGSPYLGNWGWADAIALAEGARGDDPFGYRVEAVNLMRLAQSLSAQ